MPVPTPRSDHEVTAEARFTSLFQKAENTKAILGTYVRQVQLWEDCLWTVINGRLLENATGIRLDTLGALVGEARDGRGDTDYRQAIKMRIRVNLSRGHDEDVLQVAALAHASPEYWEDYPAGWILETINVVAPNSVAKALRSTRSAGTRGVYRWSNWATGEDFRMDSVYGGVPDERGLATTYDTSLKSYLISARDT